MESWEGTELKDGPENKKYLEAQAVLISREIKKGMFDYLKWFPNGNKAYLFRVPAEAMPTRETLRDFYTSWIADKIPPLFKSSRCRKYRSHFTAHILPLQGDLYLDSYGMTELRELRKNLVDVKKLSVKTAKNVIGASLRAFFRDARLRVR